MSDSLFQKAQHIAQQASIKNNLVRLPGFSFGYLRYRIARPILKFNYRSALKKIPSAPWMSIAAINIFDAILNKEMKGFEFGSGGSTIFFSKRAGHLVSLEHDVAWHTQIIKRFEDLQVKNVDYHLVEKENDSNKPSLIGKRNDDYTVPFTPATCYVNYYSFIDRYEKESFDFIIVDGRARVECAEHAIPKLKKGGILILDNSERLRYKPVHDTLMSWKKVFTTNGLTDTTFWFKPEA
ncbi:MAG TPA: class I SAM-dependent methyltransferase [Cyclobacteriaceae bacterium]|nr:class I SAM-dependent methyltransferase [Cyclobacteriaceae bacterium]